MKYLIIPSATFVPTDVNQLYRVPMALFPINGEPLADLILKHYSDDVEPIISTYDGYEAFKKTKLSSSKLQIIKIDELKDLGFTILNTLEKLVITDDDQLIVNYADTVVDNNDLKSNCIVCQKANTLDKKWTYLCEKNGTIDKIVDKNGDASLEVKNMLLVCGVFTIDRPMLFLNCLRNQINKKGCNFYKALKEYSCIRPFNFVEAQNWLDIGHPEEYFDSKIAIKSRQFNHMVFDKNRGIIKKKSDDQIKLSSEIEWFLKLPKNLQYVTPRIYDYCLDTDNVYVEMEYYSYPTLLELFLYGELDEASWRKIFSRIFMVLNDFRQYKNTTNEIHKAVRSMYFDKTVSRIEKMRNNRLFKPFFEQSIIINGIAYNSLDSILKKIDAIVSENLLSINEFNIIHGDLCFANILIDEKLNFVKLIDPRGSFGAFDLYGDQRYDFAKIMHSIDGKYDFIIKDYFSLTLHDNRIEYTIKKPTIDLYPIAKEVFDDLIGNHLREIEIIESLLFLSMIPLHQENSKHQLMMLSIGLEILSRWVDIKEE